MVTKHEAIEAAKRIAINTGVPYRQVMDSYANGVKKRKITRQDFLFDGSVITLSRPAPMVPKFI